MKIIIFGGTSGIGRELAKLLSKDNDVFTISRNNSDLKVDVLDKAAFAKIDIFIGKVKPDAIINCVGIADLASVINIGDNVLNREIKINSTFVLDFLKLINKYKTRRNLFISSVASELPSPLFGAYASTKAFSDKLIETFNYENKDTPVTTAHLFHFKDTNLLSDKDNDFTPNDIERIKKLISSFLKGELKYFENPFCSVLRKSQINPEGFASKSLKDKLERKTPKTIKVGYLSGSFDVLHYGHINLINRAAKMCDELWVGIHEDGKHKNKELLLPLKERVEHLASIENVSKIIISSGSDSED